MRLFGFALSFVIALGAASSAHAVGPLETRLNTLERRVSDQDAAINDLYERLDRMDQRGPRRGPPGRGGPAPIPQPSRPYIVNCLVTDTGYGKTFLGSGSTQIDADFAAKKACQSAVNSTYCQATSKCDSTNDMGRATGAVCVVTDSGYGKIFRGEGNTKIAAEANAKASCQSSVNATYCNVQANCDLSY